MIGLSLLLFLPALLAVSQNKHREKNSLQRTKMAEAESDTRPASGGAAEEGPVAGMVALDLSVFQGRNLQGKDSEGLSDPYVKVLLMDVTGKVNKRVPERRSAVMARTISPSFPDGSFQWTLADLDLDNPSSLLPLPSSSAPSSPSLPPLRPPVPSSPPSHSSLPLPLSPALTSALTSPSANSLQLPTLSIASPASPVSPSPPSSSFSHRPPPTRSFRH